MKNGRDEDWDDPKITSLSAARKKAEAAKRAAMSGRAGASLGEMIVGAVIMAMAVGFLVHLARPLWQSAVTN